MAALACKGTPSRSISICSLDGRPSPCPDASPSPGPGASAGPSPCPSAVNCAVMRLWMNLTGRNYDDDDDDDNNNNNREYWNREMILQGVV